MSEKPIDLIPVYGPGSKAISVEKIIDISDIPSINEDIRHVFMLGEISGEMIPGTSKFRCKFTFEPLDPKNAIVAVFRDDFTASPHRNTGELDSEGARG